MSQEKLGPHILEMFIPQEELEKFKRLNESEELTVEELVAETQRIINMLPDSPEAEEAMVRFLWDTLPNAEGEPKGPMRSFLIDYVRSKRN